MKKRSGFTLAEVLITLGIIGVVAAITLPAINSNTGATRNRALLKKGLSTFNSAIKMNEARNGWNFSSLTEEWSNGGCDENSSTNDNTTICALLNDALVGETFEQGYVLGSAYYKYELQDGIQLSVTGSAAGCVEANMNSCTGYIDVNGAKGPNTLIECKTKTETMNIWDSSYKACEVDANAAADIFPIVFYDSTVELATNAAKAYFNAR